MPTQTKRYVYLFGADREAALARRASFSAGGAGAVAC
jgi:hypothetical protein